MAEVPRQREDSASVRETPTGTASGGGLDRDLRRMEILHRRDVSRRRRDRRRLLTLALARG